ncbi:thiol reductant ABC exporter subunit CydC [Corynebacterium alimapuense]|uniref:Thiol reductant ABC exporter subunit CydC n=2 Tax=Corynebacterium alimapuense TaxID=1576874 RepID=A0A3M8KB11_9CORY|nr:thiol reductant ABC exporter subunit CydC [Corynebacterium alimapuense]
MLHLAGVQRRQLAAAIAAGSVTLFSALALTVLSGWLITRAWEMPPVLALGVAVTAVRALGISRAVFRYLDRLLSHRIALHALTTLRVRLFDAIAADPVGDGRAHLYSRGDGLIRLVADAERVTDLIVRSLVPAGVALVLSSISLLIAGLLHPLAAVILAIGFAFTGLLIPWLAARSHRHTRRVEATDDFLLRLDEVLGHRTEFEAAGLGSTQQAVATRASAQVSAETEAGQRPLALAQAIQSWATGLTAFATLLLVVVVYPGEPTWLGMLVMLPLAAFEAHGQLAQAAIHAQEATYSAKRLTELVGNSPTRTMDSAAESPEPLALTDCRLTATDLRCRFGTPTWGIEVAPGQRVVIRGTSGSGKTTLLQTLGGLVPPTAGKVELGSSELDLVDPARLRATVRVHAEDEWLFSTSIRQNLLVANPDADDQLMWETIEAVGLGDWLRTGADSDPLDRMLADGADSVSSGQRRRLLLARALCSTAPVLLLDEPTEHIADDDASRLFNMLVSEQLPGARAERSIIMVTHASRSSELATGVSVDYHPAPVMPRQ